MKRMSRSEMETRYFDDDYIGDYPLNTVLDEVTSDNVDTPHVERRVDDWEERLNGLYQLIGELLPDGWKSREGLPVTMHEKMMQAFDVPAREIPTLELHSETGTIVKLAPEALWIVGNNGRVEMKSNGHWYRITDRSQIFKPPKWESVRSDRRREKHALTREWLAEVLR